MSIDRTVSIRMNSNKHFRSRKKEIDHYMALVDKLSRTETYVCENYEAINDCLRLVGDLEASQYRYHMALYKLPKRGQWYVMMCRSANWMTANQKLMLRKAKLLKKWQNVSHRLDVGNLHIEEHCKSVKYDKYGCFIVRKPSEKPLITDKYLLKSLNAMIYYALTDLEFYLLNTTYRE